MPDITWEEDILIFNLPGSAGYPNTGKIASCGILEITASQITPQHITIK